MTTVYEHLESYAGAIVHGWTSDADGRKLPFQVVKMAGGPYAGTVTFSTLGLSRFPLSNGKDCCESRSILHELIMIVPADAIPGNIAGILQQAGMEAIDRGVAYLRGDVLGPKGSLFEGYEPKALYAAIPVYFPDDFGSVIAEGVGDVAFVWLVPILDKEVDYVRTHGWPAFESKLIEQNPDLADYRRTAQ